MRAVRCGTFDMTKYFYAWHDDFTLYDTKMYHSDIAQMSHVSRGDACCAVCNGWHDYVFLCATRRIHASWHKHVPHRTARTPARDVTHSCGVGVVRYCDVRGEWVVYSMTHSCDDGVVCCCVVRDEWVGYGIRMHSHVMLISAAIHAHMAGAVLGMHVRENNGSGHVTHMHVRVI